MERKLAVSTLLCHYRKPHISTVLNGGRTSGSSQALSGYAQHTSKLQGSWGILHGARGCGILHVCSHIKRHARNAMCLTSRHHSISSTVQPSLNESASAMTPRSYPENKSLIVHLNNLGHTQTPHRPFAPYVYLSSLLEACTLVHGIPDNYLILLEDHF